MWSGLSRACSRVHPLYAFPCKSAAGGGTSRFFAHAVGGVPLISSSASSCAALSPPALSYSLLDSLDGGARAASLAVVESYELMNRNARNPKPANHGKRPVSHKRRKRRVRERAGDHWGLPTKTPKGCDI